MAIPKIIHYCWFGRNPKPRLAEKCIESWKRLCPDYELREWNEDNYDLKAAPAYVQQAYAAKKWAFVTDFIRLQVVYDHGGIYMDTDVELVKNPGDLLSCSAYFGFEEPDAVNTGLGFGAERHSPVIKEMLDIYWHIPFLLPDGTYDLTPCPERNTRVLERFGLKTGGALQTLEGGIRILPKDWLCPLNYETGKCRKTPNTVSIHWFSASWQTKEELKKKKQYQRYLKREQAKLFLGRLPNRLGTGIFGKTRYEKIRAFLKGKG